jgi:hypothetical protein
VITEVNLTHHWHVDLDNLPDTGTLSAVAATSPRSMWAAAGAADAGRQLVAD